MAKVCLCNDFNETQIQSAFDALGNKLPLTPSLEEIYTFYCDVYEPGCFAAICSPSFRKYRLGAGIQCLRGSAFR